MEAGKKVIYYHDELTEEFAASVWLMLKMEPPAHCVAQALF